MTDPGVQPRLYQHFEAAHSTPIRSTVEVRTEQTDSHMPIVFSLIGPDGRVRDHSICNPPEFSQRGSDGLCQRCEETPG
jgi:hypothetical protein